MSYIPPTRVSKEITLEWQNLMSLVERVQFGEVRIVIQNGKPMRAEQIVKAVKLDAPDFREELKTVSLL
jgi:hypothetical protein